MSSVRFVTYVLGSYPLYPPPAIALYFRWCIPEAGGGNLFGTLDQGLRSRWSLTPDYFHFGPPGLLFLIAALTRGIDGRWEKWRKGWQLIGLGMPAS